MKLKMAVGVIVLLMGLNTFAANQVPYLLLLDFFDGNKKEATKDTKTVMSMARAELSKYKGISMVKDDDLLKVNSDTEKIIEAFNQKSVAQELGGAVEADYVMTGKIYRKKKKLVLDCKTVRVSRGRVKMFRTEIPLSDGNDKIFARFAELVLINIKKQFPVAEKGKGKFDKFKKSFKTK